MMSHKGLSVSGRKKMAGVDHDYHVLDRLKSCFQNFVHVLCSLVALGILAGCQTTGNTMRDKLGNVYPPQCTGEITIDGYYHVMGGKKSSVERVDKDKMPFIRGTNTRSLGNATLGRPVSSIWVAKDIPDSLYEDILRHELCHIVAGEWHAYGKEQ